uniref:Nucleoporin 210 like n=1 Tax=Callorhinchus milii TaxID=7868 RepID=A0A4W3IMQ7_CALMI
WNTLPSILLPYSHASVLCYRYSTRPDVATIEPEYKNGTDCSQAALISARSTQPVRLTSIIIAEETVTGQILRCDTMVDVISQIEILSTTRELYVDDSLLKLTVRALDEEGNTFSSLEGFFFEWSIVKNEESDTLTESPSKIRILKFSEATYLPPAYIAKMETEGKQGDIILVSGLMTGTSTLKTRLQEAVYKTVPPAMIRLIILENIILSPSYDIYLLVGAFIRYRVTKIVNGKMTEIEMPSDQYKLELQNHVVDPDGEEGNPVAELEPNSCTVTALQKGQASIVLIYRNIHMQTLSHLPNCTIYVVEAAFLGFSVLPGDRWVLEMERKYEITVEVYDKKSNKVYLSDVSYLVIWFWSGNFYFHIQYYFSFNYVFFVLQNDTKLDLPVPITGHQDVIIYKPIILKPRILVFPWHPKPRSYRHIIQVTGGSGNFTWSSSNESVAMVTVKGFIATGDNRGFSIIQARDVENPVHFGEMTVYVLRPVSIEFVPSRVEIEIGQVLDLPIMVYGLLETDNMETVPVNNCTLMNIEVEVDKQGVFRTLEGRLEPGDEYCTGIQVQGETQGHTLLTASSGFMQIHFSSSITIAAYHRLRAIDPVSVAVVTLTSSKEMLFEGGPRPWVLEPSRFFADLSGEDWAKTIIKQLRAPLCSYPLSIVMIFPPQFLTFRVGNKPSLLNPNPAVEPVQVKFVCAMPTSLTLTPVYKPHQLSLPCPLLQHNKQLVPVSFCRNSVLELTAYDQHRRKFDNFTSLLVNWKSSNNSLASFHVTKPMEMISKDDGSGQRRQHGDALIRHCNGLTIFRSSCSILYIKILCDHAFLLQDAPFLPISTTIDLLLVDDVSIVPGNLTIYNHPEILELIYLTEGSGYFFINTTNSEIVNSTYVEIKNYVQLKPLQPGVVTLKAYDLCLTCVGPARAQIHVSDILDFELDLIHKVEIGKSVLVHVRILDFFKQPLLNRYFRYMDLNLQAASPIIRLEEVCGGGERNYIMKAVALGQTTLVVTVRDKNGRKLSSAPRQIEVFPPFRLIPRTVTLIIGGMMQVMSEGGPQPQSNIYFSISNHSVAKVNDLGQLTALVVGTAKVTGIVQAVDDDTGRVVVFSQDDVTVEVVQLKGIKIHAPVTRLKTGTQMPIYVMGLTSSQTPFSFGNAVPGLTFHWITTKRDVIELVPRHLEVTIISSLNFAMVIHSIAQGKTGLKVTVKTLNPSAGQFEGNVGSFYDEIQMMVNQDGVAYVTYEVQNCHINNSVIREDGNGILISGPTTGSSTLKVTALEYFGLNQTIVTGLRVTPVAYLRIQSSPALYVAKNEELTALPLGMTLTFTVHFYDLTGDKFHAQNTELYLAINRDDLLLIGPGTRNNSYVAQAANVGLTLLGVWDKKHPGIADYIPIPVQYAIWPNVTTHVVLSDVICFTSPLVDQEGEAGAWHLSTTDILQIDPTSGLVVTRSSGTATVYYDIPGVVRTYREVTLPTFNICGHGSSRSAHMKSMEMLKPETNIVCTVQFSNPMLDILTLSVFTVEPAFVADKGQYSCIITIKELSDSVRRDLSTGDTFVSVKASVLGGHYTGQCGRTEISFIPGFYMNELVVILSSREPTANITVFGIYRVLIKLEVGITVLRHKIEPIQSPAVPNMVTYTLSTTNFSLFQQGLGLSNVTVVSTLTGQAVDVFVTVLRNGGGGGAGGKTQHDCLTTALAMTSVRF